MVYERKVVTTAIGKMVFTAVIVLLGIHFMYHIEYNPIVREVMELLQEKLFCISLPQGKKVSVAYSNIYQSLSCVEDKLMITDSTDENTMDETQAFCELAD